MFIHFFYSYIYSDYHIKVGCEIMCTQTLIAVFVKTSIIEALNRQLPPLRIDELRKANIVAGANLYFFSMQDVQLAENRIMGTYFDEKGGIWKKIEFPYPDVLYNRRSKGRKRVAYFRRVLKKAGVLFINSCPDFNKWDVYQQLLKDKNIAPHLPRTIELKKFQHIKDMFNQHDSVYIKPLVGRYSRHVFRLSQNLQGEYEYRYFDYDLQVGRTHSLKECVQQLKTTLHSKRFLVQQAVQGIKMDQESMVDMRAEVQRNGQGKIEVVAISVRVGGKGVPVTSIRAHAVVYSFETFFLDHMHYSQTKMKDLQVKIVHFLTTLFYGMEHIYGLFGELGIDFILDNYEQLWLIECNAKSAKEALLKSYDEKTIRRAFLNPLKYAQFLKAQSTSNACLSSSSESSHIS